MARKSNKPASGVVYTRTKEGVTYNITAKGPRQFDLTGSTGQEVSYFLLSRAKDVIGLWALEHLHRDKSYHGTTEERAAITCAFLLFGDTDSRVFDNCAETHDGDEVFHLVLLRSRRSPRLKAAMKGEDERWFNTLCENDRHHFPGCPAYPLEATCSHGK